MKALILSLLLTSTAFAQPAALFGSISKTVTTAGTPEVLSANDLFVKVVCMQCSVANSGNFCYFGASQALAASATAVTMVKPTASIPDALVCFGDMANNSGPKLNLKAIWVNVATSGDEVNAFYIQ